MEITRKKKHSGKFPAKKKEKVPELKTRLNYYSYCENDDTRDYWEEVKQLLDDSQKKYPPELWDHTPLENLWFDTHYKNFINRDFKAEDVSDEEDFCWVKYRPDTFLQIVKNDGYDLAENFLLETGDLDGFIPPGTDITGKIFYHVDGSICYLIFPDQFPAVIGTHILFDIAEADISDTKSYISRMIRKIQSKIQRYKETYNRLKKLGVTSDVELVVSGDNIFDILGGLLTHFEYSIGSPEYSELKLDFESMGKKSSS